jgi:splicing factor 3A subunit 1
MGTPPQAGMVRSADEMDGVDIPPAKRQKVAKLLGGQYYPETDWINMHPVSALLHKFASRCLLRCS